MNIEHQIILEEIGGADVISCPALGFKHIEHSGKIDDFDVKLTILDYLHIDFKDEKANFDIQIVDNRPVQENFNEKRRKESLEYKHKRNQRY